MKFIEHGGEIVAVCWGMVDGQQLCTMTPVLYTLAAISIPVIFLAVFAFAKWRCRSCT